MVPAGTIFMVCASSLAVAYSSCDAGQSCSASAQAIADPTVEIDPSYTYKEFLSVEWNTSSPVEPPNPLVVSVQGVTNGTAYLLLNCLSNHVSAIEAATNLLSTNWVQIAEITNYTETVSFSDTDAGNYSQRFYRARALRKAN